MWRTFNELRAAERVELDSDPARASDALQQATRLPDSITFNGIRYVRNDDAVVGQAAS